MPFPGPSGGSISSLSSTIAQTAHGFTVGQWVYLVGTVYTLADADVTASTDSVGVVATVPNANSFTLVTDGLVTGLSGLTAGTRYYLSGTAGAITSTLPSVNSKAVLIANSTTSGWVQQSGVVNLVAQSGQAILTEQTFSTNTFADVAGGVFAIHQQVPGNFAMTLQQMERGLMTIAKPPSQILPMSLSMAQNVDVEVASQRQLL